MSEHSRRFGDTWIGGVLRMWPLIAALFALAASYGEFRTKLIDHEDRLLRIESRFDRIDSGIQKILEKIK